jgi:hypothetical protein
MKAGKASRITTSTIITAIAVVLASSTMITTPVMAQVVPVYTQVVKATATQNPGASFLSVTAGGNIPRFPDIYIRSVLVFGYAWVDGNTGHAIVAVIHPSFRDSNQNPDAWHTHTVTLSQGTASSNFCIQQLGTSQGGISIIGNVLRVNIAIAQSGSITPTAAASFVVQQDSGCTATGLGVKVLSGPVSISQ